MAAGRACPGASPSRAIYALDGNSNYRYRAFGVPGLGFKRDLADDSVVAPYASLLALPFRPEAVAENLTRLAQLGAVGIYGLYEAVDFTAARLPLGRNHAVVREYMAHHQGMILVALDNYLYQLPHAAGTAHAATLPRRIRCCRASTSCCRSACHPMRHLSSPSLVISSQPGARYRP